MNRHPSELSCVETPKLPTNIDDASATDPAYRLQIFPRILRDIVERDGITGAELVEILKEHHVWNDVIPKKCRCDQKQELIQKIFVTKTVAPLIVSKLPSLDLRQLRLVDRTIDTAVRPELTKSCTLYCSADYTNSEWLCKCDWAIPVNSGTGAFFPLTKFCLRDAWIDHLRKHNNHSDSRIDKLTLDSLNVLEKMTREPPRPLHPDFVRVPNTQVVNWELDPNADRSFPSPSSWTYANLRGLKEMLTDENLFALKELDITLETGVNYYTTAFYEAAIDSCKHYEVFTCVLPNLKQLRFATKLKKPFDQTFKPDILMSKLADLFMNSIVKLAVNLTHIDLRYVNPDVYLTTTQFFSLASNIKSVGIAVRTNTHLESLALVVEELVKSKQTELHFLGLLLWQPLKKSENLLEFAKLINLTSHSLKKLVITYAKGVLRNHKCLYDIRLDWPVMKLLHTFVVSDCFMSKFRGFESRMSMPALQDLFIVMQQQEYQALYFNVSLNSTRYYPNFNSRRLTNVRLDNAGTFGRSNEVICHGFIAMLFPLRYDTITTLRLANISGFWVVETSRLCPNLTSLDITLKNETADNDRLDFIFTGLPYSTFEFVYSRERQHQRLAQYIQFQDSVREDCIYNRKGLKTLVVRSKLCYAEENITDWSGYHCFALMTHLTHLTLIVYLSDNDTMYQPNDSNAPIPLSQECVECIRNSLKTTTVVINRVTQTNGVKDPFSMEDDECVQ